MSSWSGASLFYIGLATPISTLVQIALCIIFMVYTVYIEKKGVIYGKDMDIKYYSYSAENLDFSDNSFDVITACQCFWYFDHEIIMPKLYRFLKEDGRILVLYMAWLPFEDKIAGESEKLVLKYSPNWSGAGETMHPIHIPECYNNKFELVYHTFYSWNKGE